MDRPTRVVWREGHGEAVLDDASGVVRIRVTQAGLADLSAALPGFLLITFILSARRRGWHHVHGATVREPGGGRGWLLAGNRGAGKSTTCAMLAAAGWGVGSDDAAFARLEGDRVRLAPWRAPIALREGGAALVGRRFVVDDSRRAKQLITAGAEPVASLVPEVVAFPRVDPEAPTSALAVNAAEAMTELLQWSVWSLVEARHAEDHLTTLRRLVGQARTIRVRLGPDLADDPMRLLTLPDA